MATIQKGSELRVAKSLWGVHEAGDVNKWDELFSRIASEGYCAVETICFFDADLDPTRWRSLLDQYKLGLIVQVHTASDWSKGDYCTSAEVEDHVDSFRKLVAKALTHKPQIINVHSGHDSWDTDTAVGYFQRVLEIERELLADSGITLVHETHRQRQLFSPYQTKALLARPELAALKLNCDLSHWVTVCEKLFCPEEDPRDKWWPSVLATTAKHCHLIHLRVGHPEGPQVPDLQDPYYAKDIAEHLNWWAAIFAVQRSRGELYHTCVTEHGPEPYQILPTARTARGNSDEEKSAHLWETNSRIKQLVEERFSLLSIDK